MSSNIEEVPNISKVPSNSTRPKLHEYALRGRMELCGANCSTMMVFHPLGILLDLTYAELVACLSSVLELRVCANPTEQEVFKLLDTFYEANGKFIDTSTKTSRARCGWGNGWSSAAIVTNLSLPQKQAIGANYGGNHTKPLRLSLKTATHRSHRYTLRSLVGLRENFEELMLALDTVFKSGKVRHLGIADAPAWVVAEANPPPSTLRSLPMSMGSVGKGCSRQRRKQKNETICSYTAEGQSPLEDYVSAVIEKVGKEVGALLTAVMLAYCLLRRLHVLPAGEKGRTIVR
ncbi:hypothetical protein DFS33DRAFT_1446693 [Desarmillaria ectypa]|nr:hypothetical protein DFS33DRAFT_1446693 [Desarmillaria ectypa]